VQEVALKATRSEGDDLGESAARALMRHGGREDVVGEVKGSNIRKIWLGMTYSNSMLKRSIILKKYVVELKLI